MPEAQNPLNDQLAKVNAEANKIFAKLGEEVDKQVKAGVAEIDVTKLARTAGLQIDEAVLKDLEIDRVILPHPWLPWYFWFPWRPLWCWWWHRFYPWYRCCPYWWHRCHFHHCC